MENRQYWLALFTATTWQEFIDLGAEVYGFNQRYFVTALRTKPGDYFICYVAGLSRFIAVLEIVSPSYYDPTQIFSFDIYPVRMKVRIVEALDLETAVPVKELSSQLSTFQNLKTPSSWAMHFRNSLKQWKESDAEIVLGAIRKAKKSPVVRPVSKAQLAKEPQ